MVSDMALCLGAEVAAGVSPSLMPDAAGNAAPIVSSAGNLGGLASAGDVAVMAIRMTRNSEDGEREP
jgi:hypothetical protein